MDVPALEPGTWDLMVQPVFRMTLPHCRLKLNTYKAQEVEITVLFTFCWLLKLWLYSLRVESRSSYYVCCFSEAPRRINYLHTVKSRTVIIILKLSMNSKNYFDDSATELHTYKEAVKHSIQFRNNGFMTTSSYYLLRRKSIQVSGFVL